MKLTLKIIHISKENCPKITFEGQGILVQQVYLKVSISFQSFLQEHISPSATLAQNSSRDTRSSTQSLGSIKAWWPTAFNCRMTIPRTPLPTYGLLNPRLISLLRSHLKAPPHTHTHTFHPKFLSLPKSHAGIWACCLLSHCGMKRR